MLPVLFVKVYEIQRRASFYCLRYRLGSLVAYLHLKRRYLLQIAVPFLTLLVLLPDR
jgi:hypothetical protein